MLSNDDAGISHKMCGNLFWQYYDALYNTISCAIQQSRCENNVAMTDTTNSKSIVFFSAQNEIFVYVGIIHAENLFDI